MLRILFVFFLTFFACTYSFAQQDVLQEIVAGYENTQPLSEEVFVHTDKSFYVCGEVLWFKVYVLNAQSRQLQHISRTAYVELISTEGKSVVHGKVRVGDGTGDGSFYLPATLESGNFILRAYTNWMKNDPASFFEKPITVINTRKALDTSKLLQSTIPASAMQPEQAATKYEVIVNDNGQPSVVVKLNGADDTHIFLVARQGNKVATAAWAPVQNGEAVFRLDPSKMQPGITEIDIINSMQREIFKTCYNKGANTSEAINVTTDQQSYKSRSAVTLKLTGTGSNRYHLSASVYLLSDLNEPGKDVSFPSFLNGGSSFQKGSMKANGFLPKSAYGNKIINSATGGDFSFLPEMNGNLITVIAKSSGTSSPAANVPVYISVEGKLPDVQVARTNSEGIAYFNFRNLYGPSQLVLQTDPKFKESVDLSIEKSYFQNSTLLKSASAGKISMNMESSLEDLHNDVVINDHFADNRLDSFVVMNTDSLAFYGKPYKTYLLDNYKRFVTMEEVLREYVQEVNVRIRNKDYHFQTFNRQFYDLGKYLSLDYMMTEGTPLVLLDGVPVFDNNKIIKYNPLLVRKLEVVADKFHIGPRVWNGVMSFVTYKGALEDFQLHPRDIVVDFEGWQRPRYFYAPDYSVLGIRNSRVPDFRNVLYWNPEVDSRSASELKFYTGDLAGKFVVVIQGISDTGVPVYATSTFEVVR